MANKENKMLDELRRRGTIFEDPCPKSESISITIYKVM